MSRVLVFVEGQTEETFVRDLLVPYFAPLGIYLTPSWHRPVQDIRAGLSAMAR